MNYYYIYIYLDPRKFGKYKYGKYEFEYEPFYIGKGKNGRWKDIKRGRNTYFIRKINKIKKCGLEPIVFKLYENLNEKESFEKEIELIDKIKKTNSKILVNITDGGDGCSGRIVLEKTLKKLRKDFQKIKNEFERRGYILLTEEKDYKNARDTKLKYICPKGHNNSMRWDNFRQGQNCSICDNEKRRKDFSNIKKEFEKRNYILLIKKEEYKNSFTKLKYICPNGHEGYMSWNSFQKGNNCPICYSELCSKNIGEKSHNHKLTEQQVIQIKLLLKEGKLTQKEIADMFGVSIRTISNIKREIVWSHIKI